MLNIDKQKLKMINNQLQDGWYQPKDVVRYLAKDITEARKIYPLSTLLKIFNKTFDSNISYHNFQKTLYRIKKKKKITKRYSGNVPF